MNPISKLTELFSELPGIGPRQSKRFVYYLLTRNQAFLDDLVRAISELKGQVSICTECQRFFKKDNGGGLCSICRDKNRDQDILMIVSRDTDLENIEKTRTFNGVYFVLGGAIPLIEKDDSDKVRTAKLRTIVKKKVTDSKLQEIILALNATPEGEHTCDIVEKILQPLAPTIKISRLGKGISTGTELEYSDGETIKNALKNRA